MNYIARCSISIFLGIFIYTANTFAQVTIGSNIEPDADAILDLKQNQDGTSEKGLLLPRVNLISSTNPSPLTEHVEGMIVYNKASVADVLPGVFYNDGTHWKRIDILPGAKGNQVLTVGPDLAPKWGELDIPNVESVGYVMRKFAVSNTQTGHEFEGNSGYEVTVQNYEYDNKWSKLVMSEQFSVTPTYIKNRLVVTMQTIIQSNSNGTASQYGWVDYAGGVFINNFLKVVKINQFSHTGRDAFQTMTMSLIVEDLPVGEVQNVDIAVTRLASRLIEDIAIGIPVTGASNLNRFMTKPFIAIQYYEDPSSGTN